MFLIFRCALIFQAFLQVIRFFQYSFQEKCPGLMKEVELKFIKMGRPGFEPGTFAV
nr:hypothetical protein [uncultured archaeon]